MSSSRDVRESEHARTARRHDRSARLPWTRGEDGQDNAWLQGALSADAVCAFQWDARSRISRHSANASEILGLAPNEAVSAERFMALVHPADRGLLESCVRGVRPDNPAYTISFRFVRPDGPTIWLEETSRAEFDATGRLLRLTGLTRDISLRRRLDEHQARLLTELDHRVKNLLARVAAVVSATRDQAASVDEFAAALEGRITSLVNAHVMIGQSADVNLSALAHLQIAPYAAQGNTTISGPDVKLSPAATDAMAMVLHELVTNAAKYGALSSSSGHVLVQWHRELDGALSISWREVGGPTIGDQRKAGYGTGLIRDIIPHELAGKVELRYRTSGVECAITIPAAQVRWP